MGGNVERSRADLQVVTNQATKGLEQAKTAKSHLQKSAETLKSTIKGSGSEIKEANVGNYTSAQKEVYNSYKTKQSKLLHSEREEVEKPLLARGREITKGETLKTKAEQKLSEKNKSLGVFKKSEGKRIKESSKEITSLSTISRELSAQNTLLSKKITDLNAKAKRLHEAAHHTINSLSAINDQKNEIDKAISTLIKAAENIDKGSARDLGVEITQLKEQRSLLIKLENDIKSRGFDEIDSEAQYKNLMNTFDNIWMGDNEKGSEGTFAQIKKNVGFRIGYANKILDTAGKRNPGLFTGIFHKLSDTFGGGSKIERRHTAPPSFTVSVKDVPIPRSRSASSPLKLEQPVYVDGFSPKDASQEKVAVPPRPRNLPGGSQTQEKAVVPPRPRNLPGAPQTPARPKPVPQEPQTNPAQLGRTRLPEEPPTAQTLQGKAKFTLASQQGEASKAQPAPNRVAPPKFSPANTAARPAPSSKQTRVSSPHSSLTPPPELKLPSERSKVSAEKTSTTPTNLDLNTWNSLDAEKKAATLQRAIEELPRPLTINNLDQLIQKIKVLREKDAGFFKSDLGTFKNLDKSFAEVQDFYSKAITDVLSPGGVALTKEQAENLSDKEIGRLRKYNDDGKLFSFLGGIQPNYGKAQVTAMGIIDNSTIVKKENYEKRLNEVQSTLTGTTEQLEKRLAFLNIGGGIVSAMSTETDKKAVSEHLATLGDQLKALKEGQAQLNTIMKEENPYERGKAVFEFLNPEKGSFKTYSEQTVKISSQLNQLQSIFNKPENKENISKWSGKNEEAINRFQAGEVKASISSPKLGSTVEPSKTPPQGAGQPQLGSFTDKVLTELFSEPIQKYGKFVSLAGDTEKALGKLPGKETQAKVVQNLAKESSQKLAAVNSQLQETKVKSDYRGTLDSLSFAVEQNERHLKAANGLLKDKGLRNCFAKNQLGTYESQFKKANAATEKFKKDFAEILKKNTTETPEAGAIALAEFMSRKDGSFQKMKTATNDFLDAAGALRKSIQTSNQDGGIQDKISNWQAKNKQITNPEKVMDQLTLDPFRVFNKFTTMADLAAKSPLVNQDDKNQLTNLFQELSQFERSILQKLDVSTLKL